MQSSAFAVIRPVLAQPRIIDLPGRLTSAIAYREAYDRRDAVPGLLERGEGLA